jgi:hypothetical protein
MDEALAWAAQFAVPIADGASVLRYRVRDLLGGRSTSAAMPGSRRVHFRDVPAARSGRRAASDPRWLAFEATATASGTGTSRAAGSTFRRVRPCSDSRADASWNNVRKWSDRVHPDDLPAVMAIVEDHLGRTATLFYEHRLSAQQRRVSIAACSSPGRQRAPLRMVRHTDITEQDRQGPRGCRAADPETVLENAPSGFAVFHRDRRGALRQRTLRTVYGVPRGTPPGGALLRDVLPTTSAAPRRVSADVAWRPHTHALGRRAADDRSGRSWWPRSGRHTHLAADALKRRPIICASGTPPRPLQSRRHDRELA